MNQNIRPQNRSKLGFTSLVSLVIFRASNMQLNSSSASSCSSSQKPVDFHGKEGRFSRFSSFEGTPTGNGRFKHLLRSPREPHHGRRVAGLLARLESRCQMDGLALGNRGVLSQRLCVEGGGLAIQMDDSWVEH